MNRYKYRAIDERGKYVRGMVTADNQSELESFLRSSNLELVSFKIESKSIFAVLLPNRVKTKDIITLFTQLEQLDKAGVTIIEAIDDIRESSDSEATKEIMHEIYEAVKNGSLFSEAISRHPETFDPIFVGLIAAAEGTGNLNEAFNSIIDHLKWGYEMKRRTVKAVRYPIFSLLVMLLVLWVMTTKVVPKVTSFLVGQQIELPFITTALIAFSEFVQFKSWILMVVGIALFVIYKIMRRVPEVAIKLDAAKLYIPIFGKILIKLDVSRFCHFFSMTFKSGIPILECLDSAKATVENLAIRQNIDFIRQQVSDGQSLAKSVSMSVYFPTLVSRMFKIGEESGNMEDALKNVRFFYDQEINDSIEKLIGMIQPSLTIIMGGMMAWITIAVFGPIYATFQKL